MKINLKIDIKIRNPSTIRSPSAICHYAQGCLLFCLGAEIHFHLQCRGIAMSSSAPMFVTNGVMMNEDEFVAHKVKEHESQGVVIDDMLVSRLRFLHQAMYEFNVGSGDADISYSGQKRVRVRVA